MNQKLQTELSKTHSRRLRHSRILFHWVQFSLGSVTRAVGSKVLSAERPNFTEEEEDLEVYTLQLQYDLKFTLSLSPCLEIMSVWKYDLKSAPICAYVIQKINGWKCSFIFIDSLLLKTLMKPDLSMKIIVTVESLRNIMSIKSLFCHAEWWECSTRTNISSRCKKEPDPDASKPENRGFQRLAVSCSAHE